MASFEITGGKKLKGEINPQGAKNEALQVICATLLTSEKVTISNIPDIVDVNKLIDLLSGLGVKLNKLEQGRYSFQADNLNLDYLHTTDYSKKAISLRGSIMLIGPLLTRFGKACIPQPGGDKIGRRRLDTHFIGLQNLGAKMDFDYKNNFYRVESERRHGCYMLLDEASVTGTANLIMAAVLAKGTTTIFYAACEPYIQQLCRMLISMGAKINGVGSNLLSIDGVP